MGEDFAANLKGILSSFYVSLVSLPITGAVIAAMPPLSEGDWGTALKIIGTGAAGTIIVLGVVVLAAWMLTLSPRHKEDRNEED